MCRKPSGIAEIKQKLTKWGPNKCSTSAPRSAPSARDLISTLWSVVDARMESAASIVNAFVDLLEEGEQREVVLAAWPRPGPRMGGPPQAQPVPFSTNMPTAPAKGGGGPPKLSSAVPGAAAVSGGADKGADKRECVVAEYIGGEWRATGELVQNLEAYLESHTPLSSIPFTHKEMSNQNISYTISLVDHEDLPRRRLRSPPPPYRLKDPMAPSRSESQPAASTSASNAVHNPSNTNASGDAQDASKESQDDVTCENFTHYPVLLDEFFLPPFLPPPFFPSSSLTPVANLLFGFGGALLGMSFKSIQRAPGFVAPNNFSLSVLSFSTLYNTPLYFTAARLRTSANAGLHLIPNSVCVAIDSLFAGWYMRKTGRYWKLQAFAGLGIVAANFSLASCPNILKGFGKIGFAANDAATSLKMVEKGLLREDLAVAVLINFPFQIIGGWLHREGLRTAVAGRNPPVRLIALDWSLEGTAPADAHRVCAGRVAARGTNHQSLRPSKMDARVIHIFVGSSAFFTRISDRRRCSRSSRASRTTTSRSPPDVLGISLSAALTQTLLARNLRARITGVGRCCIDVQQLETAQHRPLPASASRPDVLRTRPEPLFDSSRSLRRHASRIMH
ncbi:hypothetical protein DFH07DRAFT_772418 [Mycena maculata]|uniref:ZNF598/HEL2 PAH domain-containing protein n=1 Tax=Mycena maculata TaxID=230809 RepID=A0AAD7JBH3_9AGAR|nr:hypothetical protein DFH07DRAFT_772418 [Mycena maculata]